MERRATGSGVRKCLRYRVVSCERLGVQRWKFSWDGGEVHVACVCVEGKWVLWPQQQIFQSVKWKSSSSCFQEYYWLVSFFPATCLTERRCDGVSGNLPETLVGFFEPSVITQFGLSKRKQPDATVRPAHGPAFPHQTRGFISWLGEKKNAFFCLNVGVGAIMSPPFYRPSPCFPPAKSYQQPNPA